MVTVTGRGDNPNHYDKPLKKLELFMETLGFGRLLHVKKSIQRSYHLNKKIGVDQQICFGFHMIRWFNTHEKRGMCLPTLLPVVTTNGNLMSFVHIGEGIGTGPFVCVKIHKLPRCFLGVAKKKARSFESYCY